MRFCASLIALSEIKLRNLSASYHPTDRIGAPDQIAQAAVKGEVLTGLLYLAPDAEDLHAHLNTVAVPFNKLAEKDLRSEEHTSELQSRLHLVCRLLLEKKKKKQIVH